MKLWEKGIHTDERVESLRLAKIVELDLQAGPV